MLHYCYINFERRDPIETDRSARPLHCFRRLLYAAEVTALAREAGLTAIALTDHDTVSGVGEALAAAGDSPLEVVPGVELSCLYKEKEIHILGLYIDHTDKAFLDFLDQAEIKRNSRNQLMLAAFQKDGFPITMEDLVMGNPDTVVTRAHFARALVKKGASPLWTGL